MRERLPNASICMLEWDRELLTVCCVDKRKTAKC